MKFLPVWVFAAVWALLMLCDGDARAYAWDLFVDSVGAPLAIDLQF